MRASPEPAAARGPAPDAAPAAWHGAALAAIAAAYLALAGAYALRTPPWQAPDEPAHFNYVAQVGEHPLDPPRIAPGDWDAARLEALKAARFPGGTSIDGIAYEDHQPPAYYYLASLAWRAAPSGTLARLRAVRLVGIALGLVTVLATYGALRALFADDPILAVGGAGFVAFLPMQLAVTAAVNNDALANAVAATALWVAALRANDRLPDRAAAWLGGALAGLAILTKLTAAPAVVLIAAAEALRARAGSAGRIAARAAAPAALAAAIAAPWAMRNLAVYGGADAFGLRAHDAVVTGQPRTADWIAEHGMAAFMERAVTFTFQSFWGVFGWLGVFLDGRIYAALALASAIAATGAAVWVVRATRDAARGPERRAAALLGLAIALSLAGYAWYNASFVQHQGRYLFAALPAWAGLWMAGLREWARAVGRLLPIEAARAAPALAMLGFAAGLAALAWLALERYVIPGLG